MSRPFPIHTPLGRHMSMLGWTATDFAAASGIHPRTLTDYLAGRRDLPTHHLIAAASTLQIDPDELVGDPF